MKCILYQTHHQLADFESIHRDVLKVFQSNLNVSTATMVIGPELLLCGYPLQDLCLQKTFYDQYLSHVERIESAIMALPKNSNLAMLLGGIDYRFDDEQIPSELFNCLYLATPGEKLKIVYRKILLPNYDIFDEKKYFSSGTHHGYLAWNGFNIGLMICEDMWGDSPSKMLLTKIQADKISLDVLINTSASPFHVSKSHQRIARAKELSNLFHCPFVYVNRVGAEDEILFDGQSFIFNNDMVEKTLLAFKADQLTYELPKSNQVNTTSIDFKWNQDSSWNQLFKADLDEKPDLFHPSLRVWSDEECAEVLKALQFGLQEYSKKCGFKNFLVALSGGIDSGIVLAITKLCLGHEQQVEAIFMPGPHSTELSLKLAQEICQNLNIALKHLPIKFLYTVNKNLFKEHLSCEVSGTADENLQSRLRGTLLYTRSNQTGAMVINTSNKSELSVGYSTLYGDSVGAISLIGDLFKSQIYQLSHYINQKYGPIIPKLMIERPPTAELRANQTDEQSLLPYQSLDPLLECILSYRYSPSDLVALGFESKAVEKILKLYLMSEYKRRQFCPIIKVRPKSYGFGYRVPICKNSKLYTIID